MLITGSVNGSVVHEKSVLPGRRTEEFNSVTVENGLPPPPQVYTATSNDPDKNVKYYVNGLESYDVPWHEEDVYYVLYIVKQAGETGGEAKMYYINIDFNNLASGNASVQYKEFQDDRERVIFAGTQYTVDVISVTTQKPEFVMIARDVSSNKELFLNGQPSWSVQGSEFKGERHVIDISETGEFINM